MNTYDKGEIFLKGINWRWLETHTQVDILSIMIPSVLIISLGIYQLIYRFGLGHMDLFSIKMCGLCINFSFGWMTPGGWYLAGVGCDKEIAFTFGVEMYLKM